MTNRNPDPNYSRPIYEMRHIPPSSQLTKENLRIFEEEQERVAREKRFATPSPIPRSSPFPKPMIIDQNPNQQVFVLDRVVEMDVLKDEQNKYKCCCRCTSIYKGAWIVGFLEAIIGLVALIVVIVNYARLGRNYLDHFVATVCICVWYMIALAFHFCGLQGKSSCMLIPNLLTQLITMILLITTSVLIGLNFTADDKSALVIWAGLGPMYGGLDKEAGLSLLTMGLILVGACALAFLAYIWFFYVCLTCYRYLNEQNRRRRGLVYNETGGNVSKVMTAASTPVVLR